MLKCLTLHAMNLKYIKVSFSEISYKKNFTFLPYSIFLDVPVDQWTLLYVVIGEYRNVDKVCPKNGFLQHAQNKNISKCRYLRHWQERSTCIFGAERMKIYRPHSKRRERNPATPTCSCIKKESKRSLPNKTSSNFFQADGSSHSSRKLIL